MLEDCVISQTLKIPM